MKRVAEYGPAADSVVECHLHRYRPHKASAMAVATEMAVMQHHQNLVDHFAAKDAVEPLYDYSTAAVAVGTAVTGVDLVAVGVQAATATADFEAAHLFLASLVSTMMVDPAVWDQHHLARRPAIGASWSHSIGSCPW